MASFGRRAIGVAANIARWDGTRWHALGSGTSNAVWALVVFDDGTGPALYAGGQFAEAGGVATGNVARWDGSWSALAGTGGDDAVNALAVFDDGTGPALYAAGRFGRIGGVDANRIAKFDGTSWSALTTPGGNGLEGGHALSLEVFDDGTGPALYVGGTFGLAGGVPITTLARWDGSAWSDVGSGLSGSSMIVNALEVFGGELYAGGEFTAADGVPAAHIARWNGTTWSAVGGGIAQTPPNQPRVSITALRAVDLGAGPSLFAAGVYDQVGAVTTDNLARWDGSAWHDVGGGVRDRFRLGGIPFTVEAFDDGNGVALYVAGMISEAGARSIAGIARWDGSDFSNLGAAGLGLLGSFSTNPPTRAMTTYVGDEGPFLVAGRAAERARNRWRARHRQFRRR